MEQQHAVHQNLDLILAQRAPYTLILAGDHVYKMDYRPLLQPWLFTDASGKPGYWRDVGTLHAYWQAHMELLQDKPALLDECVVLPGARIGANCMRRTA